MSAEPKEKEQVEQERVQKPTKKNSKIVSDDDEEDEVYEVEKILGHRIYKVKHEIHDMIKY